ncbi:MAG TPA: response regulator, partial [Gemmatimonadaceae bacterium]
MKAPARQVDILLVDDRAENLLALEAILEPLGQRLVRAQSGEDALRRLLDREFAVILLDVQMPGMNGFETARMIKARERTKFIPIIFLTAIS